MSTPGAVALVGSGEFLPAMHDTDERLLRGTNRRVAVIPTASALEGAEVTARWLGLAHAHYARLDATVVEIDVRERADAEDPRMVGLLEDVGMIYLSGGNPRFLVDTLERTPLWSMILDAWSTGTPLAGCSAGAMALSTRLPALPWDTDSDVSEALGLVPRIAVIPHYDRMGRMFGRAARLTVDTDLAQVVGVDEDTALVHEPTSGWRLEGAGGAWDVTSSGPVALDVSTFDHLPRDPR